MIIKSKTYNQLIRLPTFEERFEYLKLGGSVGVSTFGFDRYLNQTLYRSKQWKDLRYKIILRDDGCDLAILDREIFDRIIIHHINPITIEDVETRNPCVFNLNNLICTTLNTHNAIHYGDSSLLAQLPIERTKGDTCPWIAY